MKARKSETLYLGFKGKTGLLFPIMCIVCICCCSPAVVQATTYSWIGTTSNWANPSNWSPSGVPGAEDGDDVIISNAGSENPVLSVTPANSLLSIVFTTTGKSLTINNGAVLTVSDAVMLNSLTTGNITALLTATAGGILNCGSLQIGSGGGGTANRITTLTVRLLTINISGNLLLYSSYSTARNNATFIHSSGTITVNGSVITTNEDEDNTSTFSMGNGSRLNLVNVLPFDPSATGSNNFSFGGTGATIDYQTASDITLPSSPAGLLSYRNIIISGGGGNIKTLGDNTRVAGILTVGAGSILDISTFTLTAMSITLHNVSGGDGATISGSGQLSLGGNVGVIFPGGVGTINTGSIISAPVLLTGNRMMTIADDGSPAVDMTISGQMTSAGFGIVKATNASTLLLTGDNSRMTGTSTLTAGNLVLGHEAALGPAGQTVILTAGMLGLATNSSVNAYNLSTTGTGSLTIVSNRSTPGAGITHTFGRLFINQRTLGITGGTNAISGVTGVSFRGVVSFSGAVVLSINNVTGATARLTVNTITNNGFLGTVTGSGDMLQTGIWSGAGGITYSGTGSLTLNQANSFTGAITLNSGLLNINHASALGNAGAFNITGGTLGNTSGTDIVSANHLLNWNGDFAYKSTNRFNLGTGPIKFNANRKIDVMAGILITGGTVNEMGFNLTKTGAGTLSFLSQTVALKSLTISAGNFSSTTAKLTLAGDFINSGTFKHNTGIVEFNGQAAQIIGTANFYTLIISGDKNGRAITFNNGAIIGIANTFQITAINTSYIVTGSTIDFNGTIAQNIPAFKYYNLFISADRRGAILTLPNGTVGISNEFKVTATNTSYALSGNTVDFNGSGSQNIPSFTFNLLVISNAGVKHILPGVSITALSLTINDRASLEIAGGGKLNLTL